MRVNNRFVEDGQRIVLMLAYLLLRRLEAIALTTSFLYF